MRAFLPEHTNVRNPWLPDPEGAEGGDGGQGGSGGGGKADDGKDYKPPATQADLDRIITDRIARERAKFADYDDLKTKAAEADRLRQEQETASEKAVREAREQAKVEAQREAAPGLVAAEFRAALAGRLSTEQRDALIEDINPERYLTEDGKVDVAKVQARADILAPPRKGPKPDPSQGGSGTGSATPSVARGRELFENRRGAKKTPA